MDPVSAARSARESLARGLSALQSPGVPPALMAVAEPVAQAMGALHRIETSGGTALPEAAPHALSSVRQALGLLQAQAVAHPAVEQGMEAVASSLGVVHQLAQIAAQAPPMQAVSPFAGTMAVPSQAAPASAAPNTQPSNHFAQPGRPEPQPNVAFVNPPGTGASRQHAAPAPQAWQPPAAPQPGPAPQAWQPPAAPQGSPAFAGYAEAGMPNPAATMKSGGAQRIEAALGAHSATNFYKGLSGNDVIESGGLFIATYQIPDIGTSLVIHVSLPGGYEFEGQAVVRWTREAPQSGTDSPPGFGAQFTQISPEGRQLVYRYVRNREPLFHDDF